MKLHNVSLNINTRAKIVTIVFILLVFFVTTLLSCKKLVEVNPPATALASRSVYSDNKSASAVLTGIYSNMGTDETYAGGPLSMGYLCGASADELTNYVTGSAAQEFYLNSYTSNFIYFWKSLYQQLYVTNAAIEGVSTSNQISKNVKQQLLGEAKFLRAFFQFYATNLFGDVPYVTTTDFQVNNTTHRTPQSVVYQNIISDLLDAQSLLSDVYVDANNTNTLERLRPNKGAADALLARAYLYQRKWDSAAQWATQVINDVGNYGLDTLGGVFLKNSKEAIWQLQPMYQGYNTIDALYYILTSAPGTGFYEVSLSPQVINAFEPGDKRFSDWVGQFSSSGQTYYYPYKYKQGNYTSNPITEYEVVFRLAEQYLIRAEAEAQMGHLSDAASDLNRIRNRAGLGNTTATTQSDILKAIYHERQVELFTEWGHRWFDLKRTDSINSVMTIVTPQKGGTWSTYKALFPIPQSEINLNSNLTQNPGY